MSLLAGLSRRELLVKLGVLFNSALGLALGVPIVRYVLSPAVRGANAGEKAWISLGSVGQFPPGETRLATFRSPAVNPGDGQTAQLACWVRNVDGESFQVFAINCAHLGCPVRWFPQSGLFMCPCHGGVYYADGARASGPPERGLFEYPYKIQQENILIQASELPTPGAAANRFPGKRPPCAG
jgi:menaquinol-cytochrome c reductase iron-sulfur subunit